MIFICFTTVLLPDSPAPETNQEERVMWQSKGTKYIGEWVCNFLQYGQTSLGRLVHQEKGRHEKEGKERGEEYVC